MSKRKKPNIYSFVGRTVKFHTPELAQSTGKVIKQATFLEICRTDGHIERVEATKVQIVDEGI